jgi:hypothetical protein
LIVPCVVSAVKFGASELILSDMVLSFAIATGPGTSDSCAQCPRNRSPYIGRGQRSACELLHMSSKIHA